MSSPSTPYVTTSTLVDVVVTMLALPVLFTLTVLLVEDLRQDSRWNVFAVGLALLAVSLAVCCYVIHRVSTSWQGPQGPNWVLGLLVQTQDTTSTTPCPELVSQPDNVDVSEPPPAYDSVVDLSNPPSYFVAFIQDHDKFPAS